MKTIVLNGTLRDEINKRSTKALRREGLVPCVVYGGETNFHFSVHPQALKDLIYTNEFRKAEINIGDVKVEAFVKETQFHPLKDTIMHVDFLTLTEGTTLKTEIPITLTGQAKGVKVGGVLMQKIRKVKVKTTPDKLSSTISVDVSHLELGKSIRIRDIKVEEGIEIMNAGGIPLASVEVPRALRSSTARAEAEANQEE